MANETDYSPCRYLGNGITCEFSFGWKLIELDELNVFLENVETGEIIEQVPEVDYVPKKNEVGGFITFETAPLEEYYVVIERKTTVYQSTTYSTSTGFQGSELERSFDKFSCNLQENAYNIEKFKTDFREETGERIEELTDNVNHEINRFEAEVDGKIERVTEAVEKLDRLDEVLAECQQSATTAEEQSIIAQQQATISTDSATSCEAALSEIQQEHTQILDDMQQIRETALEDITATKSQAESEIQALGIYMRDDRLFYKDNQGIVHEFRNDFGGIPPMAIKHKEIKKEANGFLLTWVDPDDSIYQNNVYCTWGNTLIVRKEGAYPDSPFDGEVVVNNTTRNQYANAGYLDEVDTTKDYKYRAFPCSINKVYNLDDSNKFGMWIYSFTRMMREANPDHKIVYRGTNEHYRHSYMNFTADKFEYGDWENAPFLLKDRLAPCVVGMDGELQYFLNPNNYKQKEDGTPSDVTNTALNINCYMRFALLYRRKRKNANGDTEVDISNVKVNDEYKPYGGFVKPDGTLRDYIYLPIYRGSLINGKVRSMSGNLTNMSGQIAPNERNYCKANGVGHDMITHTDRELIEDLTMLMFKNTNLQAVLGQGKSNGGQSVNDCAKSGTLDDKGLFWGSQNTAYDVRLFGMDGRYGSQWERVLGEVYVNGVRKVKLCQGTSDGTTVEDYNFDGTGFLTLSELPSISGTSVGYISVEQTVDDIGTFPIVFSGSATTYECDGGWYNNSGTMVAVRGGASNDGAICGLFCSYLDFPSSAAPWNIGSSVSFKPL